MRTVFVFILVLVGAAAFCRQERAPISVFLTVKPDMFVTIKKHPMGADMVEVDMVSSSYPPELLASQLAELGRLLTSAPRGLRIFKYSPNANMPESASIRATFAVDGVIDRERGRVRIQPFLQAFAGAPAPHTVRGVSLFLDGEKPTERTIRKYTTSSVRAEAVTSTSPLSIEYRIELLSQDPRQISFPEEYVEPPKEPAPPPASNRAPLIFGLFAAAALAGGALVYLALLRGAPQARTKPRK